MPSKKQIPLDLEKLINQLEKAGIKYILVGGMAAIAQGAPLFSFDLEIVHERSEGNTEKIKHLLTQLDAYQRRYDDLKLKPDFDALKGSGHMLLSTKFGPLDILGSIEKGLGYEELIDNVIEIDFHGHTLHVLNLETLIDLKQASTRVEDQQRLKILKETLAQINNGKDYDF